jgi:hypothetical protein
MKRLLILAWFGFGFSAQANDTSGGQNSSNVKWCDACGAYIATRESDAVVEVQSTTTQSADPKEALIGQ